MLNRSRLIDLIPAGIGLFLAVIEALFALWYVLRAVMKYNRES